MVVLFLGETCVWNTRTLSMILRQMNRAGRLVM